MRVLHVRNVQDALPQAIHLLKGSGHQRDSRNGPVIQGPPVTTVYSAPWERVIFWPQRDANPFFHLYESLWMLAGRNDVDPLNRYVANSSKYSDDGITLHGAYGRRWRWRELMDPRDMRPGQELTNDHDQLRVIAKMLRNNPEERQCVLQMWNNKIDLGRRGKDVPCNLMATFQIDHEGKLNLHVFCRSNDIIWGAYGANIVQFSTLLEYMAIWIGCPMGTYSQISVNWHAYLDTLKTVENIHPDRFGFVDNPYADYRVHHVPMTPNVDKIDEQIQYLLSAADTADFEDEAGPDDQWAHMVYFMLKAHHFYKKAGTSHERFPIALELLDLADRQADWIVAAKEWVTRRMVKAASADQQQA